MACPRSKLRRISKYLYVYHYIVYFRLKSRGLEAGEASFPREVTSRETRGEQEEQRRTPPSHLLGASGNGLRFVKTEGAEEKPPAGRARPLERGLKLLPVQVCIFVVPNPRIVISRSAYGSCTPSSRKCSIVLTT